MPLLLERDSRPASAIIGGLHVITVHRHWEAIMATSAQTAVMERGSGILFVACWGTLGALTMPYLFTSAINLGYYKT